MILLADLETDSSPSHSVDRKAVFSRNDQSAYRPETARVKVKRQVPLEDPFGRPTQVSGTVTSDFQFTGYYYHAISGLYLSATRAYNPNLGRFIARDPSGESSGLNLYAYCGDSPVCNVDPTGLDDDLPSLFNPDALMAAVDADLDAATAAADDDDSGGCMDDSPGYVGDPGEFVTTPQQAPGQCVPNAVAQALNLATGHIYGANVIAQEMYPNRTTADWAGVGVATGIADAKMINELALHNVTGTVISPSDIASALANGNVVLATTQPDGPGPFPYHEILILSDNNGTYTIYNPETGVPGTMPASDVVSPPGSAPVEVPKMPR